MKQTLHAFYFLGKKLILTLFCWMVLLPGAGAQPEGPAVDVVFCMDLRASTNGLVDRLRDHLWDYVHLSSTCSPQPDLRIGFVAFARPSYRKENSYVKVIRDLTSDFELLSHDLLQIKTTVENGEQFVGAALTACTKQVSWSKDANALKVLFIVGNGKSNLGEIDAEDASEALASKGVLVNTVYCLEPTSAYEKRGWEKIAQIGGGKFSTMQIRNVYYESLHDFDIEKFHELNKQLNETYLYYGKDGSKEWNLQCLEDEYMFDYNTEGYRYRAAYKLSDAYQQHQSAWDLVDLHAQDPEQIYNIDKSTLPDTLKGLSQEELRATVIFNKYRRKLLINKIEAMIREKASKDIELNRVLEKTMNTLDVLSIDILKDLLAMKGFSCDYPLTYSPKN